MSPVQRNHPEALATHRPARGAADRVSADRVSPEQRRRNTQLGLILASVALAFMVGFVVKMTWL